MVEHLDRIGDIVVIGVDTLLVVNYDLKDGLYSLSNNLMVNESVVINNTIEDPWSEYTNQKTIE
jgi:hypothetical protein